MNFRFLIILQLLFTTVSFMLGQSPWTQPQGGGFAQIGYTSIPKYTSIYLEKGEAFNTSRAINDRTLQLYGEYGIRKKTTVILSVPLKFLHAGDSSEVADFPVTIEEGSLFGFGNIEIGVRQKLYSGKFELSIQAKGEMASANFDQKTGLRSGYEAWGLQSILSAGGSISDGYVFGYFGAGIRTSGYSSYLKAGAEGGYTFFDRVSVAVFLDILNSFNDGTRKEAPEFIETGLYLDNQEYIAFGFKFLVQVNDLIGVSAGFGGAAGGNLVARSPSLNIGVYAKWE